ncbi:gfo/Idh/MocA family oxidoreductase [Actinomadura sp. LD22]|uniref:Gfo/Idh/MocA family oxidoreductase n=1 Tax=Actinomadura physcomitrii TaxID=2650748 RepID=A0A6I4MD88_9ACTN|nr:Gfo/Idh/MocA family oxidoreductase [Actinomadura physcomitrii]MWA03673.1 gfo/Idh/MocA family oxidoreductase [Actinomadura physcomitrii]
MTGEKAVLGVGVIGCADIARRRAIPALRTDPRVRLVAVASRSEAKAREFAAEFGCAAVVGYADLLARPDIDAVYVPLPSGLHDEWAGKALRAGKHVLSEKPLTTGAAATGRLVATARDRGLALMENFMFVHHAQHRRVLGLVADGAIGEVRALHAAFTIPRRPDDDIRYQADLGGGALLDVAGYPIRAARMLLRGPLSVAGAVLRHDPELGVDLGGAALLRSVDGVTAHLTFGLENAYRCFYELWGTEGTLRLDRAFTPPADHKPLVRVERADGVEEIVLEPDDQFAGSVRCFADLALSGEGRARWARDALEQAELVEEIRRSATVVTGGRRGA